MHPHNELAFYSNESVNEMLEFFADIWSLWIPQDQVSAFKKHGNFFMDLIPGKLIGLSFNTMYLFNSNSFSVKCGQSNAQESPGDVALDWLSKTLEMARKEGLQVYITGHVPPNTVNFLDSCYYSFAKRCQEFRDVIQGQFYGHMNIDHFYFPTLNEYPMLHLDKKAASPYPHVMVNDRGERHVPSWVAAYFQNLLGHYKYVAKELEPIAMPIMVAPSVVPAFNPGFRIFQYSSEATTLKYPIGTLLGYDQYYMDLERWNETPDRLKGSLGVPSFALEYQPALAYNITQDSLSTPTWIDLAWQLTHKPKKGKSRDEKKGKKKKKHHRKDKKKDKIHTKKKEYSVPSSPGSPSAESHRGKERDSLLKIYLRHLMVSVKEFSEVEDDIDE